DAAALGLAAERALTNQASVAVVRLEAPGAAKGVARIIGRILELRSTARVAAAMAQPSNRAVPDMLVVARRLKIGRQSHDRLPVDARAGGAAVRSTLMQ